MSLPAVGSVDIVPVVNATALIATLDAEVMRPLASTIKVPTEDCNPYVAGVTAVLDSVVAFPTDVTSPVKLGPVTTVPAVRPLAVPVIFVPTSVVGVPKLDPDAMVAMPEISAPTDHTRDHLWELSPST